MEHPIVGERALFHPYFRYGVEASGFLSATITMTNTINMFRCVMRPQAPA